MIRKFRKFRKVRKFSEKSEIFLIFDFFLIPEKASNPKILYNQIIAYIVRFPRTRKFENFEKSENFPKIPKIF